MADKALSEDYMANLVRNALLVAGHEMGSEGDHWPVINATVHDIMNDVEDLKAKRETIKHVKTHYEQIIRELTVIRDECSPSDKVELENTITEIRALYRACFEEVQSEDEYIADEETPTYFKRARLIIGTLGDEDE